MSVLLYRDILRRVFCFLGDDYRALIGLILASKELKKRTEPRLEKLVAEKIRLNGTEAVTDEPAMRRYHLNLGFWAAPMGTYEDRKGNRVRSIAPLSQGMIRDLAVFVNEDPRCTGFHPAGAAEGGIAWYPTAWERAFNASLEGCEGAEPQIRTYGTYGYDSWTCWDLSKTMSPTEKEEGVGMQSSLVFETTEIHCIHFWAKYGVSFERMVGLIEAVKRAGWVVIALDGMEERTGMLMPIPPRKYKRKALAKKKLSDLGLDKKTKRRKLVSRLIS